MCLYITLSSMDATRFKQYRSSPKPSKKTMKRNNHLALLLPLLLLSPISSSDPDPLVDYCVAPTTPSPHPFTFNFGAPPCIDPSLAQPTHFATSALSSAGDTSANPFGFNVTVTNPANLPGSNAQGLAMARIDIAPGGLVPPHSHPRASEVAVLLSGAVLVGFVDTSYRLFTQQLRPGDAFVFPKGMMHFLCNLEGSIPAVAVSGLSSQSPGVQLAPVASFLTKPLVDVEVLKKAYMVSGQDVQRIRKNLGG